MACLPLSFPISHFVWLGSVWLGNVESGVLCNTCANLFAGCRGHESMHVIVSRLFSGPEEWNAMVEEIVVACAGLVQYLADAYPPDLPEYDPV